MGRNLVWLDMEQAELDAAYNQSLYAPNMQQILQRYATNSVQVRSHIGEPQRFRYGLTSIEEMDVYFTDQTNAPIHVFIHGGAWREGVARDFAYAAELFVRSGVHFVVPDFINVIEAQGDLMPMAMQVRQAVAWLKRNAHLFGGDSDRLYISGHSSGAHLAAVALTTDWQNTFALPIDTLKGGLLCSGMFDLKPVRLSSRSSYISFTDAVEQALSSQRHLHHLHAPVIVAYGSLETPEFQRQARDFVANLINLGKSVKLLVGQGYNHFEMPETLASPYGLLGRAMLELMQGDR